MKRVLLISLAVVLAISLSVVGCDSVEPGEKDTLIVAISTLHEETFLPWNGGLARVFYMSTIYENLAYLDPETLEVVPGLAESWNVSEDAKTWTFYLREGVQFHDGWGEVTAEDVKYTIERLMGEDSIVGTASGLKANVDSVEAPETYTVVVNMKNPWPEALKGHLGGTHAVWIVSKNYVETVGDEAANANPIGTGPYALKSYHAGYSIDLEAVEDHWRLDPDFKYIRFIKSPEESTRVAMLKAGEADLAPMSYDSVPGVQAAGLKIVTVPQSWTPYIVLGGMVPARPARWNPDNPWCDNTTVEYGGEEYEAGLLVRMALNYAINKQAIVDTIFHGQALVSGCQEAIAEWRDIEDWFPYNPAEAEALLTAAGYPDGFTISFKTFTSSPGAELPLVAEAVAGYWEAVGLTVDLQTVDYAAVLRPEWTGDQALDYVWTHRGMTRPEPMGALDAAFSPTSTFVIFADEDTEALRALAQASTDAEERSLIAEQFGELLRDKVAFIPIAMADEPYGASEYVGHWPAISFTVMNIDQITRP